jgi:hypothetical protein
MPVAVSENTPRGLFGTTWRTADAARGAQPLAESPRPGWSRRKALPDRADESSGRHGRDASRKGSGLCRKQRSGWNRRADGKAPRSPTNRLTGPIAGFRCRPQLCRSGRPKGTDRPTRATGATIRAACPVKVGLDATSITMQQHPPVRNAHAVLDQHHSGHASARTGSSDNG